MAVFARRALIIEAHGDFRTTLHALLDTRGWFVMSTPRGVDAMTIASGLIPQLVLFDMQLNDLDPLAVLRSLRKACDGAHVVVYGMTTQPLSASEVAELREAGLDGVLMKPFEVDFERFESLTDRHN
ncbi:MAG: response regulator [Kofleriaceae bacterium]